MIARILSDDPEEVMPPPKSAKKPLTAAQKDLLQALGRLGGRVSASLGLHRPGPARPARRSRTRAGPGTPVDRFLLAKMEEKGLSPRPRPTAGPWPAG